ncbi:hypothetical protein BJV74DRAFT_841588 [Russula compacta]|nr:hypothetical protein BJV74DRAFT_841588 [Russula compacta]
MGFSVSGHRSDRSPGTLIWWHAIMYTRLSLHFIVPQFHKNTPTRGEYRPSSIPSRSEHGSYSEAAYQAPHTPLPTQSNPTPKLIDTSQWQKRDRDVKIVRFVATAVKMSGEHDPKNPDKQLIHWWVLWLCPSLYLCCEAELVCAAEVPMRKKSPGVQRHSTRAR